MTSLIVGAKPKVRRPARTLQQLFERPRKGVQAAVGISSLRKMIPSPACRRSRGRRGGGILNFKRISLSELCGPLCLCGEVCSREVNHRGTEDHRVCTEKSIDFYWILVITLTILFSPACYQSKSANTSTSATRAVTDEAGRHV